MAMHLATARQSYNMAIYAVASDQLEQQCSCRHAESMR
jgi:hypothetical protein